MFSHQVDDVLVVPIIQCTLGHLIISSEVDVRDTAD